MKIRNVALLAGASMALTMLSVWWVTPQGGFDAALAERAEMMGLEQLSGSAKVDAEAWRFESGSTLRVEGRLGHPTMTATKDNETFVYLNVRAPADSAAAQAAPVDLAIVIDRSGSMAGKKMQNAINAAQGMVRRLREGDRVSVIAFSDKAETLVPTTVIGASSRDSVVARIGEITPSGDTCISCAIDAGMNMVSSSFAPGGSIKRVLLLSDGEPTAGVRDEQGFTQIAQRARDMGCTISSVGVDVSYNQRIMSTIAFQSNGRHYFVEDASGLSAIFDQELASLVRTVATDAEMRVAMAPGVEVVQVFDRAFRREGNTLVVPMGMFSANDEKTVLVKVRVPRGSNGNRPIASMSLSFQDLVAGSAGSCTGELLATLASDPSQASELDPLVGARIGRAETAALLREANSLFQSGATAEARAVIAQKRDDLKRKQTAFAPRAKGRRADVDGDFDRQLSALDDAEGGFAAPPQAAPGASPPAPAQIRANEANATDMAF